MSTYNPPPNWPPPPPGWTPPPGWKPNPAWGPPPPGWRLWLDPAETAGRRPGSAIPALGWVALAASIWCCGFASFVPPLWGGLAEREDVGRRRRLFAVSALMGGLIVLAAALVSSAPTDAGGTPTGAAADAGGVMLLGLWLFGIGTAIYLLWRLRSEREKDQLPGVAEELERRGLRAEYRQLAEGDPAMALSIGVGRPDLARQYDDGGLVDVNHVPRDRLAGALPISGEEAQRLADARDALGRFSGLDEAAVYAELDPSTVTRIRELAIFL